MLNEGQSPPGCSRYQTSSLRGKSLSKIGKHCRAKKRLDPMFLALLRDQLPSVMPTVTMEETALLGMDDVELRNIMVQFPSSLRLSDGGHVETRVRTDRGDILVAVQGDRSKPAIVTYHDIGINYICFQSFFNYMDMRNLMQNFCVYHVNAPGQEEGAATLPDGYIYPSMAELSNQLNYVMAYFGLKSFIGFGLGLGAHILAKFALSYPAKVDALVLVNATSTPAGWLEWGYQKLNVRALRNRGMTSTVLEYLVWHHFGRFPENRNADLVAKYRSYFGRYVNPGNLALLLDSYVRRTDLGIDRARGTLAVPVLNATGADSPHLDDTVVFNGRINPNNSTWLKLSDCAMVLEEQTAKFSTAFRLFLQGEGYAVLALQKLDSESSPASAEARPGAP